MRENKQLICRAVETIGMDGVGLDLLIDSGCLSKICYTYFGRDFLRFIHDNYARNLYRRSR